MPTGVLLLNIGTPSAPDVKSVRRYLREFLSDPQVIDLPGWQRWLLLNLFILPFRPKRSAAAYQKIWQANGSPLLNYSQQLQAALTTTLGPDYVVVLGMRYGQPSIAAAISQLKHKNCEKIFVLPLFPQYATAATGSALTATLQQLTQQQYEPSLILQQAFYDAPEYLQALATIVDENIKPMQPDYVLFSFHGIPERQLLRNCYAKGCDHAQACPAIQKDNQFCYRAQCYATAKSVAEALNMDPEKYGVAFQSRLGRATWVKPYLMTQFAELAKQGVKNLAIVCPSFVLDCLETLEEIGIRGKEQWQALGGETLTLIPALNSHPLWIEKLTQFIKKMVTRQ